MKKIVDKINEISNESSTNKKKEILETIDEEVKTILKFNFDKSFKTNISDKKITKVITNKKTLEDMETSEVKKITSLKEFIDYLEFQSTGKDKDILTVQNFINQHEGDEKNFLISLAQKDLKLGLGLKEFNKVFPGILPTIEPMLAHRLDKYPDAIDDKLLFLTEKYDGNRVLIFKKSDSEFKIYTRNGLVLENEDFKEITSELHMMPADIVIDGEMIAKEGKNSLECFRNTSKIIRTKGEKKGLNFLIFDLIPIDEFISGKSKDNYTDRRTKLEKIFENLSPKHMKLVPLLYKGKDISKCRIIFRKLLSEGAEGAMINLGSYFYETGKRSKGILKMKEYEDSDLKVTGITEGKGKNKNKLGAFIVDYKGETVNVGTGISPKIRELVWSNQDDYIGMIIEVKHFGESTNKDGKVSLRHPCFERFREDKDEVNF